ncbi:hypothetical protein AgCh_035768 [Apium graveolens]
MITRFLPRSSPFSHVPGPGLRSGLGAVNLLGWTGAAYVRYFISAANSRSEILREYSVKSCEEKVASLWRREIKKIRTSMRSGNSLAFLYQDIDQFEHSKQAKLPRVTVVLPLKGFGEHNLHNWRSQMTSLYGGPIEFLFIVDSKQDPAYHAVSRLLSEYKVGAENMHKDSKYIVFLDDDVRLHPGSIGALTAEMEKNPDMHSDDFRKDTHGVVSGLRDGGYSDDMTLAAIAGAHKRLITSPPVAVFPHPLASDLTFARVVLSGMACLVHPLGTTCSVELDKSGSPTL